jgi:two-component system sensor histidine kinase PilS (NtrC family)
LGSHDPALFFLTSSLYLGVGLASLFSIRLRRPGFCAQVYTQVPLDILAVTLWMHASGGIPSGLGMLLVVAVAGGALLTDARAANLFAAFATLAILVQQVYADVQDPYHDAPYTQAGIYGLVFFVTVFLANRLARQVREAAALARQRGLDLANLAELNERIIQHIEAGILVLDDADRIHLMNTTAWFLLGQPADPEGQPLSRVTPALARRLAVWRDTPRAEPQVLSTDRADLLPRFSRLGAGEPAATLVLLEDATLMTNRAQQMKLASLGRLTASIAHEIRNPLGAISHAAQLLRESEALDGGDRRLTEIVLDHSRRMNTIVESVLQLSRRERSQPEAISLGPWLASLAEDCRAALSLGPDDLALSVPNDPLVAYADPSQLRQVLWNLCENAAQHTSGLAERPRVLLRARRAGEPTAPCVEVMDRGTGIPPELARQVFEPFFTTRPGGTGLGLYIARELCDANRARLNYLPVPGGGSRFRITLATPPTQDAHG